MNPCHLKSLNRPRMPKNPSIPKYNTTNKLKTKTVAN